MNINKPRNTFRLSIEDIMTVLNDNDLEYTQVEMQNGHGIRFNVEVEAGVAVIICYPRAKVVLQGANFKKLRKLITEAENMRVTGSYKGLLG